MTFSFSAHKMSNLSRLPTKLTTTGSLPSPLSSLSLSLFLLYFLSLACCCHVQQTAARLVAMSKRNLDLPRLAWTGLGNSLRSNYFKLPGNVAWLTSCLLLLLPPPAARHMCGMWGCLSGCVCVAVCVCLQQLLEHGSNIDRIVPWRLCRHRRPIGTDRADCLPACWLPHATCHIAHATRRML